MSVRGCRSEPGCKSEPQCKPGPGCSAWACRRVQASVMEWTCICGLGALGCTKYYHIIIYQNNFIIKKYLHRSLLTHTLSLLIS